MMEPFFSKAMEQIWITHCIMVNDMKKGIVEAVDSNYIYVIFEDESRIRYLKKINVKENDQVMINDSNEIVEVYSYDQELYKKIKQIEKNINM